MLSSRIILFLFGILVKFTVCLAECNDKICEIQTDSCGLIPPGLPKSFIMKAEVIDLENGGTFWEEEYFDYPNLRAKFKIVQNGTEYNFLFEYDTQQIISYYTKYPGISAENDPKEKLSCTAVAMDDSPYSKYYGYLLQTPYNVGWKMYNSYEAFRYLGDYKYSYKGEEFLSERGIPITKFYGCVCDEQFDSTYEKTFYWNSDEIMTASGDLTPVKIQTFGETVRSNEGNTTIEQLWLIENVVWFQADPEFDEKEFQVPRGMYCKNYLKKKKIPKFPEAFSARLEATTFIRNMKGEIQDFGTVGNEELWFDSAKNLARLDYVLTFDDFNLLDLFGDAPVSAIYDVNQGVVYYTNKLTGECVPFPISSDSFIISDSDNKKLATVAEVLGFDSDEMEYKGKNFARNVYCDVWASQTTDDNETIFVEMYLSTDGWHSESDEDNELNVPIRISTAIYATEGDKNEETVSESNIFKFKAKAPPQSIYDINRCWINQYHKYLYFKIEGDFSDFLPKNHNDFIVEIREAIADNSKVESIFRIQNTEIYTSKTLKITQVSFVLTDPPQLYGQNSKIPGVSINSAIQNLKKSINSGDFGIRNVLNPASGAETIKALPNSLIEAQQQADTFIKTSIDDDMNSFITKEVSKNYDDSHIYQMSDDKDDSKNDGYSPGSLAALAVCMLLLGVGIGIGLMYFYFKKYVQGTNRNLMVMTEK